MALTDNLIASWHMNNDWTDSAGSNDGSATGATFDAVNQKLGSACGNFDGIDDFVNIGDTSDVDFGASDFSIAIWVKRAENGRTQQFIAKDAGGIDRQFLMNFQVANTILLFYWKSDDTAVFQATNATIADTNWHMIVGQKIGGVFKIWIDNVDQAMGALTGSHGTMKASSADLHLGSRQTVGFEGYYKGLQDAGAVWSRGISSAEIAELWNGGAGIELPISVGAAPSMLSLLGVGNA